MKFYLALLLDYFTINHAREKRNFIRLYLACLGIGAGLGLKKIVSVLQGGPTIHTLALVIAFLVTIFSFALVSAAMIQGI